MVEVWLTTEFSGGRHERRVRKIHIIEEGKDPRNS
jgi:ribose 5-phosphate isomerase RpiB